jgi:hypothetical protein
MKDNYSLLSITKKSPDGKTVDGTWIQGAVNCTLEDATKRAIGYERKVWGIQTEVAVVRELPSPVPLLHGVWVGQKRLDTPRTFE